jgi:hypothetical protein
LSVRNPLNTVVSVAAKTARAGVDLLGAEWLLRALVRGMVSYYRSFLPAIESGVVQTIRYEDVQDRFEYVATAVGSACEAELTPDDVAAMKERFLNKDVAYEGHYWRPEERDKWRVYLGARHLEILAEEGLSDILEVLGYRSSLLREGAESPQTMTIRQDPAGVGILAGLFVHCLQISFGDDCVYRRLGLEHKGLSDGLSMISNVPGTSARFDAFIRETEFSDLVKSCRI